MTVLVRKGPDKEEYNPVLKYYLIAWGKFWVDLLNGFYLRSSILLLQNLLKTSDLLSVIKVELERSPASLDISFECNRVDTALYFKDRFLMRLLLCSRCANACLWYHSCWKSK